MGNKKYGDEYFIYAMALMEDLENIEDEESEIKEDIKEDIKAGAKETTGK